MRRRDKNVFYKFILISILLYIITLPTIVIFFSFILAGSTSNWHIEYFPLSDIALNEQIKNNHQSIRKKRLVGGEVMTILYAIVLYGSKRKPAIPEFNFTFGLIIFYFFILTKIEREYDCHGNHHNRILIQAMSSKNQH